MIDLKSIINACPNCLSSRAVFKSVLMDKYPDEKRMINILTIIFECGIAQSIKEQKSVDKISVQKYVVRLENEYGISQDFAIAAIGVWADALGVHVDLPVNGIGQNQTAERMPVDKIEFLKKKREQYAKARQMISAGNWSIVFCDSYGVAEGIGGDYEGKLNLWGATWENIVAVSAGAEHTVGLKSDGTVVASGWNKHGQCNVESWKDIVAISAGPHCTFGLKANGTVVSVGQNTDHKGKYTGQCDVEDWEGIIAVAAGGDHTIGLRYDGTVVAAGLNDFGQCDIDSWTDIVAIDAENLFTTGLRSDGTVIATGILTDLCDEVTAWTDIIDISIGGSHLVGLKSNGSVVVAGSNYGIYMDNHFHECDARRWRNVVAITAEAAYTAALLKDGTLIAAGENNFKQCNLDHVKLFNHIDTLDEERDRNFLHKP